MAKPWEKNWQEQTGKPWERTYSAQAETAVVSTDPNARPSTPAVQAYLQNQANPDAVPMHKPPELQEWETKQAANARPGAFSGVKSLLNSAGLDRADPVVSMFADAAKTTAIGGPEAAMTIANNALGQSYAGLKGMVVDPLMGENATNTIRETVASNTYQPRGENAQKLLAGIGEAFAPAEKMKSAVGDKVLDATGSPGLATAAYVAPDVIATTLGASTVKPTKAPGVKPKATKPVVAERDMTPEQLHEAAADTLLKNNVRLTTEQRGGAYAKTAASLGRAADTLLGKSRVAKKQLQDFTSAVLKKVGIDAKNATPDTMLDLRGKVEAEYKDLTQKNRTKVDSVLGEKLANLAERAEGDPQLGWIKTQIARLKKGSEATPDGAFVNGEIAQEVRSDLSDRRGSANAIERKYANEMLRAIDDAFERSNPGPVSERMADVRERFHRMKQIEDSVAGSDTGQVSPAKLLSVMSKKRNRGEAVYGRGDQELIALAKAGKHILQDAVGNSGTATRSMDIAKIAAAFSHPILAAKVAGAVMGGRLLNEGRTTRGTTADIAARNAKRAVAPRGDVAAAKEAAARAAAVSETEEQKKRRLAAEALRGN
jgi:hypothetical protein